MLQLVRMSHFRPYIHRREKYLDVGHAPIQQLLGGISTRKLEANATRKYNILSA